jgi:hypothetical protein
MWRPSERHHRTGPTVCTVQTEGIHLKSRDPRKGVPGSPSRTAPDIKITSAWQG